MHCGQEDMLAAPESDVFGLLLCEFQIVTNVCETQLASLLETLACGECLGGDSSSWVH
jgi:hypothetical protein